MNRLVLREQRGHGEGEVRGQEFDVLGGRGRLSVDDGGVHLSFIVLCVEKGLHYAVALPLSLRQFPLPDADKNLDLAVGKLGFGKESRREGILLGYGIHAADGRLERFNQRSLAVSGLSYDLNEPLAHNIGRELDRLDDVIVKHLEPDQFYLLLFHVVLIY